MSSEIVKTNGNGEFTADQVDLIKRTIAPGLTNDEMSLYLYHAKKSSLDPLAKQILAIKRSSQGSSKITIQTSIDGYRLIADRTGKYAGNDDPVFAGNGKYPDSATVTVYKIVQGVRCPFSATARWTEYYPGENAGGFMWRKMPFLMLGKCAEALALRKAFPAELSGLYTNEEMDQAQETVVPVSVETIETKPSLPSTPQPSGNNRDKIEFLKKCNAAYLWLEKHKVPRDMYDSVLGSLGFERPEQVSDPATMKTITDEYSRIMREIMMAGTNKLPKEAA